MEPVLVETHEADGLANLASQYRGATNLRAILSSALEELQEAEQAHWDLYSRRVDSATGATLDLFASLVGISRESMDDDLLRRRILAEVLVNTSKGRLADMEGVLSRLAGDDAGGFLLVETPPAALDLYYEGVAPSEAWRLLLTPTLQRAAPAGVLVGAVVEAGDVDGSGDLFGHEDDPTAEGFGVGQYATVTAGPRGDTFYYDCAAGEHEAPAETDC